ncbi:MAG: mechanosensitive ion channel family protein [Bacilli bacterium]|nr:mechanosensitive ion channel family protein [Bacilli bacterium]
MYLFSITSKILSTIGIIVLLIVCIVFIKKTLLGKDKLAKKVVFFAYTLDFVLLISAVTGLLFLWGFDFTTHFSSFFRNAIIYLEKKVTAIIASVVVFFVTLIVFRFTKIAMKQVGKKEGPLQKRKKTIAKVVASTIKYVVGIIAILVILAIWGVNVVPALAGLGIAGLVVGLGAQQFINDLISGFFIIFEHHFDVGDVIEVGGFKGEVIDIGLKTTKIRNWKGEVRILANGNVDNITNFSLHPSVAVVDFSIAYEEDIEKTIVLLNQELPKIKESFPQILEDPTIVGVTALGDSAVTLRATCKTEQEKHYAVERYMRQAIKKTLNDNGIEIPFPQIVINRKAEKNESL